MGIVLDLWPMDTLEMLCRPTVKFQLSFHAAMFVFVAFVNKFVKKSLSRIVLMLMANEKYSRSFVFKTMFLP